MPFSLSGLSHAAAFLAYCAFAIFLAVAEARTWLKGFLTLAAVLTAAWAASAFVGEWSPLPFWLNDLLGVLRDGAWYGVVLAILYLLAQSHVLWRVLAAVTG